jgi:hypothetical protein
MFKRSIIPHVKLSQPWVAAAAMTLGVSTLAFGAYTILNPDAFTSKTHLQPERATPAAHAAQSKLNAIAASEAPIVLDEVRIFGRAHRASMKSAVSPLDCENTWHSLASGPASRTVRGFCPATPSVGSRSTTSSPASRESTIQQHVTAPREMHEPLNSVQAPEHGTSLKNLLPAA